MGFMDRAIEAVAGRGLAERHERRRLERTYKNAPQSSRQATRETREPVLERDSVSYKSTYASTEPLPQRQPREGSIRPYRVPLQTTRSELVEKKARVMESPTRPPDITAWEMPDEKVTHAYSISGAAGVKLYRLPPMPMMEGVGCSRVAVEADDAWKIEHLERYIRGFECLYDDSDRLGLADSHPELHERYLKNIHRDTFASATSSRSGSNLDFHKETLDHRTGTRISRGFLPPNSSSAVNSLGKSDLRRRDSSLSTKSNSGGADFNGVQTLSQQSTLHMQLSIGSNLLATIDEAHRMDSKPPRQRSIPCFFDVGSNPESAMASVDDEQQSLAWSETWSVDSLEGTTEVLGQANCTQRGREVAPKGASKLRPKFRPEAKKGLDRPRTSKVTPKGLVRHRNPARNTRLLEARRRPGQ